MAKILAEVEIDLAGYVGVGNVQLSFELEGHMAPPSSSIDCVVNVSLQRNSSPVTKSLTFSTYRAGEQNAIINRQSFLDSELSVDNLLNDSRQNRSDSRKASQAMTLYEQSKTENERLNNLVRELEAKLSEKTRENEEAEARAGLRQAELLSEIQCLQNKAAQQKQSGVDQKQW